MESSGSKQSLLTQFFKRERNTRQADQQQTLAEPSSKRARRDGPGEQVRNEIARLKEKGLLVDENIGESWFNEILKAEFNKDYYEKLSRLVLSDMKNVVVYPPSADIFSWTQYFNVKDTKVVIVGQDPYHGAGQAHGLCFSVRPGVSPPPSLKNIYKELENNVPNFKAPNHGYLLGWAQQGVLLLNSVLTVKKGKPNSYQGQGWETLTDSVIKYLNEKGNGIVFILWGAYAQRKGVSINPNKHKVLKSAHPSPFSCTKFFSCHHFALANEYLESVGKQPIDWTRLPISD